MGQGTRLEASPGATAGVCVVGGNGGRGFYTGATVPGRPRGARRSRAKTWPQELRKPCGPLPRPQGSNPGGRPGSLCGHLQGAESHRPPMRPVPSAPPLVRGTASSHRDCGNEAHSPGDRHVCVCPCSGLRDEDEATASSQQVPSDSFPGTALALPNPPKGHRFRGSSPSISVARSRDSGKRSRMASPACARRMQQLCVTPGLPRRARLCPPPPNSPPGGSSLERPPSPASSSPCEVPGPWRWVVVTATGTPPPRRVRLLSPEKLREPGQRLLSPPTGPGGRGAGWPLAWV